MRHLVLREDRPLIGVVLIEDGRDVTHYVVDEADTGARSLAGAWSDLDWEETAGALDRIRHESTPTSPIDHL